MPSRSKTFAAWTFALSTKPCVSAAVGAFFTRLPGSWSRSGLSTPVVFADWQSTMPALGWGSEIYG